MHVIERLKRCNKFPAVPPWYDLVTKEANSGNLLIILDILSKGEKVDS